MDQTTVELLKPAIPNIMTWETTAFWTLATAVAAGLVSIAASQLLLSVSLVIAVCSCRRKGIFRSMAPLALPLLLFMAWTVIAAIGSHDVPRGLLEIKKFFLYSLLFLVPVVVRDGNALLRIYRMIFAASAVAASAGLVQFALTPSLDLHHRISGFMSHWMTFSGLLMLVLVTLAAYASCRRGRVPYWMIALGLLLIAAVYLSETRNAWLGSVVGLAVVFALKRPRIVLALAGFVLGLYLISPSSVQQRLRSGWDTKDPETQGRIELAGTAARLIKHNPWTGVGPKNVNREALRYRGTNEFPDWLYQHMHNNALQIAAERGIPGLIFWLWLMVRMGWDSFRVFRSARNPAASGDLTKGEQTPVIATAALGAWCALLVAGMFEYNFGDSEVVTLFLFIMAAPYVFLRSPAPDAANSQPAASAI